MRIIKKTLLDEFAMAALPAVLHDSSNRTNATEWAHMAYVIAKAMMSERALAQRPSLLHPVRPCF